MRIWLYLLIDLVLIGAMLAAGWYCITGKNNGCSGFYPILLLVLPAYVVSRAVAILISTVKAFKQGRYAKALMNLLHLCLLLLAGLAALFLVLLPIAGVSTNPPG